MGKYSPEFSDKSGRFRREIYIGCLKRFLENLEAVSIEMNGETFIVDSRINCTLVVG